MSEYLFRQAQDSDIPFLVETVISAEKSGTSIIGLSKIFCIEELELRKYLTQMFEEGIDGCEFSLSSFIVAEFRGLPIAAFGGWIEGENEDNMPSSVLKSNLLGYFLPKKNIAHLYDIMNVLKDIQIEREINTHQLEYGFVTTEHKGKGIIGKIIEKHLEKVYNQHEHGIKSYVQVFENNISAIRAYQKAGYRIVKRVESKNNQILAYLPYHTKLLMEKDKK